MGSWPYSVEQFANIVDLSVANACSAECVEIRKSEKSTVYVVSDKQYQLASDATFLNFLSRYLQHSIGEEWLAERVVHRRRAKHPLAKLIRAASCYQHRHAEIMRATATTHYIQCCAERELYTLANDLVTLDCHGSLDIELIKRLKTKNGYQGARYELAVAAGFVRSGFSINWLSDEEASVEFIASFPDSAGSVAVEVKSRHRRSNWGESVEEGDDNQLLADIDGLYILATKKSTLGHPLAIFIDCQLPYEIGGVGVLNRLHGLKTAFDNLRVPSRDRPAPEFMLHISTCGWYFQLEQPHPPPTHVRTIPLWTSTIPRTWDDMLGVVRAGEMMYQIPQANEHKISLDSQHKLKNYLNKIYQGPRVKL